MTQEAFSNQTFKEIITNQEILRAVDSLGFTNMTPIQAQAIPILMEGHDVIGQAQTGTGKTAAFGIPMLQKIDPANKNLQAIVLCPTRELAVQAANELRNFAKFMHDVKVLPVYGGQDILRQIKGLKGVQIIVGTPGRVMDHMRRHTIKMHDVHTVVLDEADEMLNMGFREDMEVILSEIDHPHQTCLFSATMPQEILDLAGNYQDNPQLIKVTKDELTISTIKQYYYSVKREYKTEALKRLLTFYRYTKCIIFCNTKAMVSELSEELQKSGYAAEGLHGDLAQNQRDSAMGRFRGGSLNILIATDIAARGIDVDDVEAVINYDLPLETAYYVHRIGRTGRAGKEGVAHTIVKSSEFRKLHDIEKICHTQMEERKVPTPSQIQKAKENEALEKARKAMGCGIDEKLIDIVEEFCLENNISAEELAAAFLKHELGDKVADLEIDLPGKNKKSDDRRGRFGKSVKPGNRDCGHKGRERRNKAEDSRRQDGNRKLKEHDAKNGRKNKKDWREIGDFVSEHLGKKKMPKEIRNKNKERGYRELKKAMMDVRMDGSPYRKNRKSR